LFPLEFDRDDEERVEPDREVFEERTGAEVLTGALLRDLLYEGCCMLLLLPLVGKALR
jgi:hypothetical protein